MLFAIPNIGDGGIWWMRTNNGCFEVKLVDAVLMDQGGGIFLGKGYGVRRLPLSLPNQTKPNLCFNQLGSAT